MCRSEFQSLILVPVEVLPLVTPPHTHTSPSVDSFSVAVGEVIALTARPNPTKTFNIRTDVEFNSVFSGQPVQRVDHQGDMFTVVYIAKQTGFCILYQVYKLLK